MQSFYASKKTLLFSFISTLIFAAVLSFFPQYYMYVIIAYFIIMPIIMAKYMSKHLKEMKGPSGGKLLHEEDARDLFDADPEGGEILKAQMRQNMLGMLPIVVLLGLAFTLWPVIEHLPDPWMRFAAIFGYFESYTILNYLINRHMMKKAKDILRPIFQYRITDKGIQIKPFGGISFPLKDYEIRLVKESKAVDLISKREGQQSLRIYSKQPEKVYDILKRVGGLEEA